MDNTALFITALISALIELIIIVAIIRTASNTKAMRHTLEQINEKLSNTSDYVGQNRADNVSQTSYNSLNTKDTLDTKSNRTWRCKCGELNSNIRTFCYKCGTSKDDQ